MKPAKTLWETWVTVSFVLGRHRLDRSAEDDRCGRRGKGFRARQAGPVGPERSHGEACQGVNAACVFLFSQNSSSARGFLYRKEKLTLVVVMSAVDWWKSARYIRLPVFFAAGVQWILVRGFGKLPRKIFPVRSRTMSPQLVRRILTRCTHDLHNPGGL